MANSKKKITSIQPDQKQRKLSEKEEKRLLFSNVEKLVDKKGLDTTLDKVNEKINLVEYQLNNPSLRLVIGVINAYQKRVPLEFYRQIYRLNGWRITDETLRKRPGIVGKWTVDLIYLRFPEGTIEELRRRNPMMENGERLFKHFQMLTPLAEFHFDEFVKEAIEMMKECRYWNQFIRRFAKKNNKPWQADFFDD